jgi:hypothetical protein
MSRSLTHDSCEVGTWTGLFWQVLASWSWWDARCAQAAVQQVQLD